MWFHLSGPVSDQTPPFHLSGPAHLRVHFFNLVYKMHITKHLRMRTIRIENMVLRGSVLCCESVVDCSRSNKTEQKFVFKVSGVLLSFFCNLLVFNSPVKLNADAFSFLFDITVISRCLRDGGALPSPHRSQKKWGNTLLFLVLVVSCFF